MRYTINLPLPPSLNTYYLNARRTVKGGSKAGKTYVGRMISPEGLAYRGEVARAVRFGHRTPPRLSGRLQIVVAALAPAEKRDGSVNNNRRDLDNLWKCLNDALTKAEVVLDDALFDSIQMVRWNPVGRGFCLVSISPFEPDAALRILVDAEIDPRHVEANPNKTDTLPF